MMMVPRGLQVRSGREFLEPPLIQGGMAPAGGWRRKAASAAADLSGGSAMARRRDGDGENWLVSTEPPYQSQFETGLRGC